MNFFYQNNTKTKTLTAKVLFDAERFIHSLKNDLYISHVGILGPCARGQGFYYSENVRSDIDFFVITTYINTKKQAVIQKKFYKFFDKKCSILFFSPNSFHKPDLMFYEASQNGIFMSGRPIEPIPLSSLSNIECLRNVLYRGCSFLTLCTVADNKLRLKSIDENVLLYYYAKLIHGIGEALLLLENKYVADNTLRDYLIQKSILAKKIAGFCERHHQLQLFRQTLKFPVDVDKNICVLEASKFAYHAYTIICRELFNCVEPVRCSRLRKTRPSLVSSIASKILFTKSFYQKYGSVKVHLSKEPIIHAIQLHINLLCSTQKGYPISLKQLEELLQYWHTAGWFYSGKRNS